MHKFKDGFTTIKIDNIVATTADYIVVIVHETGKREPLPRFMVEFFPGHVVVPAWLGDKILAGCGNENCRGKQKTEAPQPAR